jgi:hypothetical protein
VTFADSVRHLVRAGARIDPLDRPDDRDSAAAAAVDVDTYADEADRQDVADLVEDDQSDDDEMAAEAAQSPQAYEPGLADLEAAVSLVSTGLAKRVILSGFPSWPGLLWRAYQLADTTGVLILPTVVRPGGKVDIVITRETAANE